MLIFTCRYWTDNGACYYYTTGNFSNYEDVIVAVKKEADEDGTPFRYVQVTFNTILTYNTYHITHTNNYIDGFDPKLPYLQKFPFQ